MQVSTRAETHAAKTIAWIFIRKERWGLSWQGWLLATGGVLGGTVVFSLGICPFLAVTERVAADTMVVEGWIPEYLTHAAADEFRSGQYRQLLTTGGPWLGQRNNKDDYHTWAWVGADRLEAAGIAKDVIRPVPCRTTRRDRTYVSALALREWLRDHHTQVHRVNVVTEGLHARRTRLVFEKALGKDVEVGVIALPTPDYDLKHWWRSSESFRQVIGETLAYLYAKFFFSPPTSQIAGSGTYDSPN